MVFQYLIQYFTKIYFYMSPRLYQIIVPVLQKYSVKFPFSGVSKQLKVYALTTSNYPAASWNWFLLKQSSVVSS